MGYTQKIISGFSWETILKIATYGLTVVKIYFLARILNPADFGLFSLALIALGVSESMTQTGINLTIMQSEHSVDFFLDTAWVISIIRGFAIGIIMMLVGYIMSFFYNQPELITLVGLSALIPVIKGFINPYIIELHKKMYYRQDTLYRFAILAIQILLSLALGAWFRSAFGLVIALILSALIEVFSSFVLFNKKPIFNYLSSRAKIIFDNARWLSIGTLLQYLVENIDDFLVGTISNTYFLGIYHNAYSLTHKATSETAKSVHYGSIPVLTKIANDQPRLKKAFFKSFSATLMIALLASIPIYLFNESLVTFLLGDQWLAAIPVIRPLIIAGFLQTISMSSYTLMLATKKYKIMNLHMFISLVFMVLLIWYFGKQAGFTGAVNGLLWSRLVTLPIICYYLWQFFKPTQPLVKLIKKA